MAGQVNTEKSYELYKDGTCIDRRMFERTVPMKVLVLGLCRTGTLSVRYALKQLGYIDTYHMRSASTETPGDCKMWMEALKAKYDGDGVFEKEDWDRLLGHCQAVCDFPAAAFGPELIAAYPNAKVILTNRDVESWYRSCTSTINAVVNDSTFRFISKFDWAFQMYQPMLTKLWNSFFEESFEDNGRRKFHEHYEEIRRIVPPGNLLEYSVEQGWGPLCEFLKQDIPNRPFPMTNSISTFREGASRRNRRKLAEIGRRMLTVVGVVGLGMSLIAVSGWVGHAHTDNRLFNKTIEFSVYKSVN